MGASPEPNVAALQISTPTAASRKRGRRSPRKPATGEISAYVRMNSVESEPACVSVSFSDAMIDGMTAAGTNRST